MSFYPPFTLKKKGVKDLIDKEQDSVRVYALRNDKYLKTIELGTSKVELSEII